MKKLIMIFLVMNIQIVFADAESCGYPSVDLNEEQFIDASGEAFAGSQNTAKTIADLRALEACQEKVNQFLDNRSNIESDRQAIEKFCKRRQETCFLQTNAFLPFPESEDLKCKVIIREPCRVRGSGFDCKSIATAEFSFNISGYKCVRRDFSDL